MEKKYEVYVYREAVGGLGTFFYTECGNRMYSVNNDPMLYHGKMCPACAQNNKNVTLYILGSDEANKYVQSSKSGLFEYRDDDYNAYLRSVGGK